MPKTLIFQLNEHEVPINIEKINDENPLGKVEKQAVDQTGNPCHYGAISADGMHLFSTSFYESGYVDEEGNWLDKTQLQTVNDAGEVQVKHESSFKHNLVLQETVSMETFLMSAITDVYQLTASDELLTKVQAQIDIYVFPFNFSAAYRRKKAYLIERSGIIYLFVGKPCEFNYIGLDEISSEMFFDDDEDEDDFSLL